MIQPITQERWQQAQIAEAGYHARSNAGVVDCHLTFYKYARHLGIEVDQQGKSICEIGCGPYPATRYCENIVAILIEPIAYPELNEWAMKAAPRWYPYALEDMRELPATDECWLLNCLQHVIDPELFVSKCKQIAPVIRFFEPIDFPVSDCHPHTFTIDDFIRWFGHAERYKGGSDEGFHTADCAYGTWRREGLA